MTEKPFEVRRRIDNISIDLFDVVLKHEPDVVPLSVRKAYCNLVETLATCIVDPESDPNEVLRDVQTKPFTWDAHH